MTSNGEIKNATVRVWDFPVDQHFKYAETTTQTKQTLEEINQGSRRVPPSTQVTVTDVSVSALDSLFQTNSRKEAAHIDPPPGGKMLFSHIKNQAAQIFGSPTNLEQQMAKMEQFVQQQPNAQLTHDMQVLQTLIEKGEIPRQTSINQVLGRMASILQG